MISYRQDGTNYCSLEKDLPLPRVSGEEEEPAILLFDAPAEGCRGAFSLRAPGQLACPEGLRWLDGTAMAQGSALPPAVLARMAEGRQLAVNIRHPRWRRCAKFSMGKPGKKRLHLLALGDVGATLLMGLKLLGGQELSAIGICDIAPQAVERWEFEMNQVASPEGFDKLPLVEPVEPERLFDCDVFVFAASRGVPPLTETAGDVRMAQFAANRELVERYAIQAREAGFGGLFAVLSDPVDPLCKAAFLASNRGADGRFDGHGLLAEQIQGYGLGVMHARAGYFARKEERFASYLTQGRAYGPHGEGLVVANSLEQYDDGLSQELTELTKKANLRLRELGFKPYAAPALSSGALSLLATLRGQWHEGSVYLGGVYFGVRNRYTPFGQETALDALPPALYRRLEESWEALGQIL